MWLRRLIHTGNTHSLTLTTQRLQTKTLSYLMRRLTIENSSQQLHTQEEEGYLEPKPRGEMFFVIRHPTSNKVGVSFSLAAQQYKRTLADPNMLVLICEQSCRTPKVTVSNPAQLHQQHYLLLRAALHRFCASTSFFLCVTLQGFEPCETLAASGNTATQPPSAKFLEILT